MATRINTNMGAMIATLNLNKSFQSAQTSIAKLSSGLRIYRAGEDPAGTVIYSKLKADVTTWEVAARNCNEGVSALQVADSGAARIAELLVSMKALAEAAASGTSTSSSRAAANASYSQLAAEISSISTTMKYGEVEVLNKGLACNSFQIGISTGSTTTMHFSSNGVGGAMSGGLNTDNIGTGGGGVTLASSATSTGMGLITNGSCKTAITSIDTAIDQVGVFRGDIGAMQNTLEAAASAANNTAVNLSAAASTIGDVDFATEVASFTQSSILAQAGLAFMAQANLLNQSVLALIG
jgi:flagellin